MGESQEKSAPNLDLYTMNPTWSNRDTNPETHKWKKSVLPTLLGCFHTHRLFADTGNGSSTGLWVFTDTDIAGTVGQFVFFSDRREMCPHINTRYLLALMYLIRRYRERAREYWVHPLLTVRYMEGSFYTLFEKLINHNSKFYNYFLMSIGLHTFDFLVDCVANSILLFFLILVKLFFQNYINFSPSLCFYILSLKQSAVLSHKQGLLSTSSIKVTTSYLNNVHILKTKNNQD